MNEQIQKLVKHSGMKTGQTLNVIVSGKGKSIFWSAFYERKN